MKAYRILNWLAILALAAASLGSINVKAYAPSTTIGSQIHDASASQPEPGKVSGSLVSGPQVDPSLEAAPDHARAHIADPQNPAWQVVYGTQAGQTLLPPRLSLSPGSTDGPQPELTGTWDTQVLQTGTASITAIASIPDGRLFVGVDSNGLRVYAPDANGVYAWTEVHATTDGLASDNVTCLAVYKNELWVGTSDSGISALNLDNGTWRQITPGLTPLPSLHVNRMTVAYPLNFTAGPYIWMATDNGAAKFDGTNWTVIQAAINQLANNNVLDIAIQNVFVGLSIIQDTWFTSPGGIDVWNGGTGWTHYGAGNSGPCLMTYATRLLVDRENTVWFAAHNVSPNRPAKPAVPESDTAVGACRYSNGSWTLYNSTTPGLPSNWVTDLSMDNSGRVWLSTLLGGAASYDQGAWAFYTTTTSPIYSDNVDRVSAIGEAVWFGHHGATVLSVYSPNWLRFNPSDLGGAGSPGALLVESSDTWAGIGPGLSRYDQSGWNPQTIPGNGADVTSLARDGGGLLWIGTAGNGVFSFDGASFTHFTNADGLPGNDIRALLSDSQGRLWAATDGGLALRGNGYWLGFTTANSPLLSNNLQSLTQDQTDRIWIGTATSGISILDLNATGNMWSSQTTTDGLPSNSLHGLATDPAGDVWAATEAGLGQWSATAGTWTVYNQAGGSLPDDRVLNLATDPLNRIWAGTAGGLGERDGSNWAEPLHVPGSTLGSDRIGPLAGDATRLWAAAGDTLAVRGVLTGPIGSFPPVINTFTPTSGVPGTQITISGDHFDARGPSYNKVWIGTQGGSGGTQAPIVSVSQTSMVVIVPGMAHSGKIFITAHGLNVESATDFTVQPEIRDLSPTCLGLGQNVRIYGSGWNGPDPVFVKIGNGPYRIADYHDPYLIQQFVRPGDTDGSISVRVGNSGPVGTSVDTVAIAAPQVAAAYVQQGVQGEPLIWGKRTLVQVTLQSGSACKAHVDGGTIYWKWKGGTTSTSAHAYFTSSGGLDVAANAPQVSLNTAANFVMEPPIGGSLANFDGVSIQLKNGPVTLLTYDIPASQFKFQDVGLRNHILAVPILPPGYNAAQYTNFLKIENKALADVVRAYPQPDGYYGDWISHSIAFFQESSVNLGSGGDFDRVRSEVDDYRSLINDEQNTNLNQAVALVAQEIYTGGPSGKAISWCLTLFGDCNKHTSVVYNFDDTVYNNGMTPIFLQETIHGLNWVQSWSPNYASYNDYHSRYDEGQWSNVSDCVTGKTFRQALIDELGYPARVVWLGYLSKPSEFPLTGCDPSTMPRSAMSYAPIQQDRSAFLEPLDFNYTLSQIMQLNPSTAKSAAPQAAQSLRLNGDISQTDVVTITLSYLGTDLNNLTPAEPLGSYHLLLRAADKSVLLDQSFSIGFQSTHGESAKTARFDLHVAFPAGTVTAEIRHGSNLLWSQKVSAHAPTVDFTAPNGGTFSAAGTVPVQWNASDADGDPLQFFLEYSSDNGTTWQPVALHLNGSSYSWKPGYVEASGTARLRLTASDGFNTSSAVSAPFNLTARPPTAVILEPQNGAIFLEGESLHLSGSSLSSSGENAGSFTWLEAGATIGTGQQLTTTLDTVGTYTYTLQVADHGLTGSDSVKIQVQPDFDRDGMPDLWELAHGLNPLDPSDALADPDGDGLTNLKEYQLGTDPQKADTDGDGAKDGAEVNAGTDPLRADQKPSSTPLLIVGSGDQLTFNLRRGQPAPAPVQIGISNGGPGSLNWTASSDKDWLQVSPGNGSAPGQLSLNLDPTGLSLGAHLAHITVSASGAGGSPYSITVDLKLWDENGRLDVFLPVLRR